MARMRLQKLLAASGVASRRAAEEMILAGRVAVNGSIVTRLGATVDPETDRVSVGGKPISIPEPKQHLLLYKPVGYLSTARDERGRPTVMDLVGNVGARLYPVGRLDKGSEGLILLTNDGELALRLTHPRYGVEKEYLVQVSGQVNPAVLERLRAGAEMGGRMRTPKLVETASTAEVAAIENLSWPRAPSPQPSGSTGLTTGPTGRGGLGEGQWLRIVLGEGYKREMRELCRAAGLLVRRLVRVRIGPLTLRGLRPGEYRALSADEVATQMRLSATKPGERQPHL